MWTLFWDMHSGGGTKEPPYEEIYIEAPENEAKTIFYNRFGHNPERVTCTCCGEDYSISSKEDLAQVSGYHRGCHALETPRDPETGLYQNDHSILKRKYYYEEGEDPPKGWEFSKLRPRDEYQTLEQYSAHKDVLVIPAAEITSEQRCGNVPEQGYVWKD